MGKYKFTKLACYIGYVVQAVINNFLPILFVALQDIYSFSYEQLARIIAINFISQIAVDAVSPKIIGALGYKKAAICSQFTATVGFLLLAFLPRVMSNTYIAIVIPAVVYAVGSGLMEVIISPIVELLPTDNKAGNMSLLHSFYCWGQAFTVVITTVLVYFFGFAKWMNIPLIWAALPLLNMTFFFFVPVVEPTVGEKNSGFSELIKSKTFWILMLMMLCSGASEIAMSQWASLFAQRAIGVPKVIGDLAGPCAFALTMGVGRSLYAAFSKKISFEKLVVILSAACFGCYLVVAICKAPFFALLCCALCGLCVSVFWPGTLSLGTKHFSAANSAMFGIFAMLGDMGCCLGPWLLGIVADSKGLNAGFIAASVFPVFMIVSALLLKPFKK